MHVEIAIADVLAAAGRTNQKQKLVGITDALVEFRSKTGLIGDGTENRPQGDTTALDRFLFGDDDS